MCSFFVAPNYNALVRDGMFKVALLQRKRILLRIRNKRMIQNDNQPLAMARASWGPFILAGYAGIVDSSARFALEGLGTPAPVVQPRHLA